MTYSWAEYLMAKQMADKFSHLIPPSSITFTRSKGKEDDLMVTFPMEQGRSMSVYGARRVLLCDELDFLLFLRKERRFYVTEHDYFDA